MSQDQPQFDNQPFAARLAEDADWYNSLSPRPNYPTQVQQSDNPEQLPFTDEEKVASGKAQTKSGTWSELEAEKLGTPETIASEQPEGHPDFSLKSKDKFKAALQTSIDEMENGKLPVSVLPLKPTLQKLLKVLDKIPDGENWKHGGFTTLDDLAGDIGKNFTVSPICEFFESTALFEQSMKDPAEFQQNLQSEIAKLKARLEALDTLNDFDDEEDQAAINHILQNPDFPEHQYADLEEFEDSCGAEQEELEERLWQKRTELLNHLPAVLKIVFDSYHGENTLDKQVSSLKAKQKQAIQKCRSKKKEYMQKKKQLTDAVKELQRRVAAVQKEQKASEKRAKQRRSQYKIAHEEEARAVQDIDKRIVALLEQRKQYEEAGRQRTAQNDAAERQHQCETAARNDALEMLRGCEEELQPYVDVFHKSAEVADVMSEVAVTTTDAVIKHTKSKVEDLQKQETQTLLLHYNAVCETFSETARDCALAKHNHQEEALKLEKNKAAVKKARRLREGTKALEKLKHDKQEIEKQKQHYEERLAVQDERMTGLKTPEFQQTVDRLGALYFGDVAAAGSTAEGAAAVAAVSGWVTSSLPPATPFDELLAKSTAEGETQIPEILNQHSVECERIDSILRQPQMPMLLQGTVPGGDDSKGGGTVVTATAVAGAAGGAN